LDKKVEFGHRLILAPITLCFCNYTV